jgi:hypothetical protein
VLTLRPCEECQKWWYEDDSDRIHERGGKPMLRPSSSATPCQTCPKKSPQEAHRYELNDRSRLALEVYRQVKASHGACLSDRERRDPILLRNLAIIDRLITRSERREIYRGVANEFIAAFFKEDD